MPNAAKNKENRHLSVVCPILRDWWGAPFKKVPASGALRWGTGHWTYADIVPPEDLPFVIECKHHYEVDLDEVIRKDWDQGRVSWFWYGCTIPAAIRASNEHGHSVFPMLIYKMNKQPNRLVLQSELFYRIPESRRSFPWVEVHMPQAAPFVISGLEELLKAIPRRDFEEFVLLRSS